MTDVQLCALLCTSYATPLCTCSEPILRGEHVMGARCRKRGKAIRRKWNERRRRRQAYLLPRRALLEANPNALAVANETLMAKGGDKGVSAALSGTQRSRQCTASAEARTRRKY